MRNPSDSSMISQIWVKSGTMTTTGLNRAFTDSGNSVLPAYPGFIVIKIPANRQRELLDSFSAQKYS